MPKHPNALQRVPRVLVANWTTCQFEVMTDTERMFQLVDAAGKTGDHVQFIHESGGVTEMNIPECWQDE